MRAGLGSWVLVGVVAPVLIALDLFVVPRRTDRVRLRTAAGWTLVWTALGLAFGLVVWAEAGQKYAIKYATGYVVERGMTIDLVLVFAVIVARFRPPDDARRRVIFIALWAGLLIRLPFIGLGATMAEQDRLSGRLLLAGGLAAAGVFLFRHRETHPDPHQLWTVRRLIERGRVRDEYLGTELAAAGPHHRRSLTLAGLLLVALLTADFFFAVTIPIAFAYSKPAFLVLASNVFALLGFRSLYYVIEGLTVDTVRLKVGLAIALWLVAVDLAFGWLFPLGEWTLLVLALVIIGAPIALSVHRRILSGGTVEAVAPGHHHAEPATEAAEPAVPDRHGAQRGRAVDPGAHG